MDNGKLFDKRHGNERKAPSGVILPIPLLPIIRYAARAGRKFALMPIYCFLFSVEPMVTIYDLISNK